MPPGHRRRAMKANDDLLIENAFAGRTLAFDAPAAVA